MARDDHGNFIAAAAWTLPHVSTVDSAEINAIRNGRILAANIGYTKFVIESDNRSALDAISNREGYMG